jgi:uncharacterized protein YwqG
MVSSIIKSSSIKFEYENKEDNFWRFYTSRVERVYDEHREHHRHHEHNHHEHHHHEYQLYLEMKVLVPEVGIVTQKFEVSKEMFNELSDWMHQIHEKK